MILGPNPATASQRHTIGIERLELNGSIRRYFNIEGTVVLNIYLAKDTSLRHRKNSINRNAEGSRVLLDICVVLLSYPFKDSKSFNGPGGQPFRLLKVININIQAIESAVRVFLGNNTRSAIRLWTRVNRLGLDIMIIRIVKD
jgi:hypothetical protein